MLAIFVLECLIAFHTLWPKLYLPLLGLWIGVAPWITVSPLKRGRFRWRERYRGDGACTAIPQLPDPGRAPARACALAYRCAERYDLVWVALDARRGCSRLKPREK